MKIARIVARGILLFPLLGAYWMPIPFMKPRRKDTRQEREKYKNTGKHVDEHVLAQPERAKEERASDQPLWVSIVDYLITTGILVAVVGAGYILVKDKIDGIKAKLDSLEESVLRMDNKGLLYTLDKNGKISGKFDLGRLVKEMREGFKDVLEVCSKINKREDQDGVGKTIDKLLDNYS